MIAAETPTTKRADWTSAGFILACALIVVSPLAVRGNSCGHDFDFHLQSWMDVARQWHQGVWYPQWISSANYGAGEPRLVFYPPASWLLGGVLGALFPWSAAPFVLILLCVLGAGLTFYWFARAWLGVQPARTAACLYAANPYLLFVVYERGAIGELLAAVWIPLVLLFVLERRSSIVPLSLAIAAAWLTNAPAAVMVCYTVALLAVFVALHDKQWKPILRAGAAAALGIGVAAFYIVPAAYERRWVEIDRAIGPDMRVEDSFLFMHTGEAFHDQVLRTASIIAVVLLLVGGLGAWRALRMEKYKSGITRALTLLLAAVAILLLPVSEMLWEFAPELKFLQFPWRWLLVAAAATAFLAGAATQEFRIKRPMVSAAAVLAVVVALTAVAARYYWQPCDDEDAVSAQVRTFQDGAGFEGTDEYTPRNADNSAIQQGLPAVRLLARPDEDAADISGEPNPQWAGKPSLAQVVIEDWSVTHKTFRVESQTAGFAVLRLMDYPAWRVRVNGREAGARPHRNDGLMTIAVTSGTNKVDVWSARTTDTMWGCGLSFAALGALIALAVREKKQKKVRIS